LTWGFDAGGHGGEVWVLNIGFVGMVLFRMVALSPVMCFIGILYSIVITESNTSVGDAARNPSAPDPVSTPASHLLSVLEDTVGS